MGDSNNDGVYYIITQAPEFCPGCGHRFQWNNPHQLADFRANAAHTCPTCGAHFQHATEMVILVAAHNMGGDL